MGVLRFPILLLLLLLAGCGYQMGQETGGEGRTVAVPLFLNETIRRDQERDLTRLVQEEIRVRTRFTLVTASSGPDLLVKGRIADISEQVLSQEEKGTIRESSVIFRVVVDVLDSRSGVKVLDRAEFIERRAFAPEKGETLRSAELLAMRALAERIVYSLSSGW